MNAFLIVHLLLGVSPAWAGQPPLEGKWAGEARLPGGIAVKLYLTVSNEDGRLKVISDVLSADPPLGMIDFEDKSPSFDGKAWRFQLPSPKGKPAQCEAYFQEDGGVMGDCVTGDQTVPVRLRRDDSNPWVALDFEVAESSPEGARYLEAVTAAVKAFGNKDFENFDQLFTANPVGMQPNELYGAAFRLVIRFGAIRRLEFVELDGDSARLRLQLGETERDFVVSLEEEGKIRELTYVPPDQRHLSDRQ